MLAQESVLCSARQREGCTHVPHCCPCELRHSLTPTTASHSFLLSSHSLTLMSLPSLFLSHTFVLVRTTQYGGSEAHAAFFQKKRGEWDATTQSRDLMTSIR